MIDINSIIDKNVQILLKKSMPLDIKNELIYAHCLMKLNSSNMPIMMWYYRNYRGFLLNFKDTKKVSGYTFSDYVQSLESFKDSPINSLFQTMISHKL